MSDTQLVAVSSLNIKDRYIISTIKGASVGLIDRTLDHDSFYCVFGVTNKYTSIPGYSFPYDATFARTFEAGIEWLSNKLAFKIRKMYEFAELMNICCRKECDC